jgi:hypothetical protein
MPTERIKWSIIENRITIRCGKNVVLNLHFDAIELLHELSPSKKGYGGLISELIRREKAIREERARMKAAVEHAFVTAGEFGE